jgi:hypothetical protein
VRVANDVTRSSGTRTVQAWIDSIFAALAPKLFAVKPLTFLFAKSCSQKKAQFAAQWIGTSEVRIPGRPPACKRFPGTLIGFAMYCQGPMPAAVAFGTLVLTLGVL